MLTGKPAILVPSPNVAEDHQTINALALTDNKAAEMVKDSESIGSADRRSNSTIKRQRKAGETV